MADGAVVEESAMLRSASTGAFREVDVTLSQDVGPYPLVIAIEAVARSRKADLGWVDQMVGKHADLPTDKLVLVAEAGFTRDARSAAVAAGAVPIAPEDLDVDDPVRVIVNALPSLWPKWTRFTMTSVTATVTEPVPPDSWQGDLRSQLVVLDDGREVAALGDFVGYAFRDNWIELMRQIGLRDIKEDEERQRTFTITGPVEATGPDGDKHVLCLKTRDGTAVPIAEIVVVGDLQIRVSEISLKHDKLGDAGVMYSFGEGLVGPDKALLVITEDDGGGQITTRFPDGREFTHEIVDLDMTPRSNDARSHDTGYQWGTNFDATQGN
jgi:hypothetical protein